MGFKIYDMPWEISLEDYEEVYGRKEPEILEVNMDPSESISHDEITFSEVFKDSSLDFMDPINGEEAYFGDNNEYKVGMIALVGELHRKYNEVVAAGKRKEKAKLAEELYPILEKIEKFIEKTFNIERCYFGLFEEMNANSMPLCWDKNLVTVNKEGRRIPKRTVNQTFKASLEDIVETSKGYKYKDKSGKIFIINFGLGFFDEGKYSDEECAAIITHEIGHAMQQAMCSINQNLAMVYTKYLFDTIYTLLNPFVMLGSFGFSVLIAALTGIEYAETKGGDPEEIGEDVIAYNIGANREEYNRERFGKDSEKETEKTVKKLRKKRKQNPFLKFIGRFFSGIIGGITMILFDLLSPIMNLINIPSNIFQLSNLSFLKKNRKFEQFADMFTSVYGLGPAQASALAKLGNTFSKQNYGAFTWVNYVPVLNTALALGHYMNEANTSLLAGYPDTKGRIVAIYKTLQIEIDTNKDLTNEQKNEIKAQIEQMDKVYSDYVFDWSPKGFVYAFWHKITFKKLKNEKSDVQENILDSLKDMKKEAEFKAAKNKDLAKKEENNKKSIGRKTIMAAFMNALKSIREIGILKGFTTSIAKDFSENL